MIIRKRKILERVLEKVPNFAKPKIKYEQYLIPSRLAADILWIAENTFGDIYGMKVIDLGCGTGRLTVGAALLGADYVLGVDIDLDAINIAKNFLRKDFENLTNVEYICCDINYLPFREEFTFDTVIQNPPFGVHKHGYDIMFLNIATKIGRVIYTIHKSSTRDFIVRYLTEKFNCRVQHILTTIIPIPPIYPFHEKRRHNVEVDVFRIEILN